MHIRFNFEDELLQAANWWKANYKSLAQSGKFVLNLMKEWGDHKLTSAAYATAYNNALKIVRQVYSGTVIIDAPGWGQEAQIVKNAILGTDNGMASMCPYTCKGEKEGVRNFALRIKKHPSPCQDAKFLRYLKTHQD